MNTLSVFADTVHNVDATIQISVCGNNVIEGGEDCEGSDLNGETCLSLGYGPGTLKCDIACTFDTYSCAPAPTPTPTITPTPTPSSVSASESSNHSNDAVSQTSQDSPLNTNSTENVSDENASPRRPDSPVRNPVVRLFDFNGDNVVNMSEVFPAVQSWVQSWTRLAMGDSETADERIHICDINDDDRCNLVDFSVLMYYVERR